MTYTALSIDRVTGYDMIGWAFYGVSPLTDVVESDPKLGKELANVKGFGEIDHPPWLTGTHTCFHTGCSCACDCTCSSCASRKTFPKCFPTATVAPQRRSLWYTQAPNAVATYSTRGSL